MPRSHSLRRQFFFFLRPLFFFLCFLLRFLANNSFFSLRDGVIQTPQSKFFQFFRPSCVINLFFLIFFLNLNFLFLESDFGHPFCHSQLHHHHSQTLSSISWDLSKQTNGFPQLSQSSFDKNIFGWDSQQPSSLFLFQMFQDSLLLFSCIRCCFRKPSLRCHDF